MNIRDVLPIEYVVAPMDPDDTSSEGTLAIVVDPETVKYADKDIPPGTHFITPPESQLQVGVIVTGSGQVIQPHYHPPIRREVNGTPEVVQVIEGRFFVRLFTSRGVQVWERQVGIGTILILLSGGHSFESIDSGALFEVKQGPYAGPNDKRYFNNQGV